jgi:hypothetical protein
MCPHMHAQIMVSRKSRATDGAEKRAFSSVRAFVCRQSVQEGVCPVTPVTFEGPANTHKIQTYIFLKYVLLHP